jgi:hypothetical protein
MRSRRRGLATLRFTSLRSVPLRSARPRRCGQNLRLLPGRPVGSAVKTQTGFLIDVEEEQ